MALLTVTARHAGRRKDIEKELQRIKAVLPGLNVEKADRSLQNPGPAGCPGSAGLHSGRNGNTGRQAVFQGNFKGRSGFVREGILRRRPDAGCGRRNGRGTC